MTGPSPPRPSPRRPARSPAREVGLARWATALIVLVVLLVGAGVATYWFVIRSDAQPEAEIVETEVVRPDDDSSVAGTWTLTGSDSFAGFRVEEDLRLVRQTVTGRTSDVEGSLEIDGDDILTAAQVTVDMTTLATGTSQRDNAMRDRGLESNRFPEASFTLTEPVSLPSTTPGETITVDATGDLTLHGVTRPVTIPLEARYDGTLIQVVGELRIEFADYEIEEPTGSFFDIVEPAGVMELQLFFAKS